MIIIGILLVGLTTCLASSVSKLDRIVGGRDASIEEVPWQISAVLSGTHNCGGSIIGEFWIISAAHCYHPTITPSVYVIRVGSDVPNEGGFIHEIDYVVRHPNYGIPATYANDVALIRLKEPISFSAKVQPIELPEFGEEPEIGGMSVISGFGTTTFLGSRATRLQLARVPVISQESCRDSYGVTAITNDMLCAGFPDGGIDACQLDSGGPLVINGKLHGIISWGRGCAWADFPGVYARVSHFREWIRQHIGH